MPIQALSPTSIFHAPAYTRGQTRLGVRIWANIKQTRKEKDEKRTFCSPMLTAEVLASRLGLEMAVADLERLFLHPGANLPGISGAGGRRPVRVAYQGVPGSYCHEAAAVFFPSSAAPIEAFPSGIWMEDVFSALEDGSADRAVVPAENSLDGPIDRNIDLLLRHPAVRIVGEVVVPVNHCLLAASGVEIADLRHVVSHPQALVHCNGRIRSLDLTIEEVADAAEAARAVAEHRIRDTAVIGSRMAAREFGLRVLEPYFQDEAGNYNRFLQLAVGPLPETSHNRKSTVAFSLEKGVSGLSEAMWAFESRGVPVIRVDHRPNKSDPIRFVDRAGFGKVARMDYVFVVDVEGSETDPGVVAAIARLEEIAGFARVLGSYSCTLK
ncbi:hypothetical protein HPP92_017315 [Vanilla planifolia]|uniref:Prephenate dehydratase domain-containing protein n=1 Tax=Vanilla planifolia TaxID=51239 RepID=A0A835QCJ2_VANPL|nr:hypothetical protein HPP92_017315 [Vanilla planifolia]